MEKTGACGASDRSSNLLEGTMNLSTPIEKILRIGPQYQKKLKRLGIKTLRDLLFHFPHRYENFSNVIPIKDAKLNETVCLKGRILEIKNIRTWKKRMILTQAIIGDETSAIKTVWFNQPYLLKVLKPGDLLCLAGKIARSQNELYLSNPSYEKLSSLNFDSSELLHTGRIVPVYQETEGLSSRWLRHIIRPLLIKSKNLLQDPLPERLRKEYDLLSLQEALWQIHFPDSLTLAKKAKERFSFEELFNISLYVLRERLRLAQEKAFSIPLDLNLCRRFTQSLPFKLTLAQKKAAWQILKDLEKPRPMNRLLEGDVGSGKTVVATLAALLVAKAGLQTAFMAPTEILAKQHFKTIWELLKNFNVVVGLLTGKENKIYSSDSVVKISRKKMLEKVRTGQVDILIGTHALIQKQMQFEKLALVILDEQHRFGVEQRAKLTKQQIANKKQIIPHLLSMTATPIPRTLALTIYGDLDLSLIDELPKGRKKIITKVIPPENRKFAYDFIKKEVMKGKQVFVICPRIEQNQKREKQKEILSWAEAKAVKEEYDKLSKIIFPDLRIGMLHGRMKSEEKEKIMQDFKKGGIDVLVSTSVVEVGVDVPNATVMMIEGAERFGLAQLHQFRGRVGRSNHQAFCFLFTESPAKKTQLRLKALLTSDDGFKLAEKDLEIRGPGSFDGTRQWGIPDLLMDSLKDIFLVARAKKAAKEILEKDPQLKNYPLLRKKLAEFRWRIHLE